MAHQLIELTAKCLFTTFLRWHRMAQGRFQTWILFILLQLMIHTYIKWCKSLLMPPSDQNSHEKDHSFSSRESGGHARTLSGFSSFHVLLCSLRSQSSTTLYLAWDFQVQQKTNLAEKSLFFKDWRIKSCPAEDVQQERSEPPPCQALPQETGCFLMVPFGILEEFFISFFTFSPGFLLSSATHRQTNSSSRTKENLIPTQWLLRVGLGTLLICAEMRTLVLLPTSPIL